jgi:hypothetical protein
MRSIPERARPADYKHLSPLLKPKTKQQSKTFLVCCHVARFFPRPLADSKYSKYVNMSDSFRNAMVNRSLGDIKNVRLC